MQDIKDLREKIDGHAVDTEDEQKKAKEEEAELRKQLQVSAGGAADEAFRRPPDPPRKSREPLRRPAQGRDSQGRFVTIPAVPRIWMAS